MKTNALVYNLDVNNKKVNTIVKIRLDDQCKNGHQDFSITATFFEIGKSRTDRNMIAGGCCHDEIKKHFPELQQFIKLHLCDFNGVPMHAIANGFFFMTKGFNDKNKDHKEEFCEYYRVNSAQYDQLIKAKDQNYFGFLLVKLGILEQWKDEATKAIKELEKLTGNTFVNDSVKSQFNMDKELINNVMQLEESGFYSNENIALREAKRIKEKNDKIKNDLIDLANKDIEKIRVELKIKLWLHSKKMPLDNIIYYNHTNKLSFNWKGFGDEISEKDFDLLIEGLNQKDFENLPNAIEFELKGVKSFRHS